jgi:hypothetical protein
MNRHVYFKGSTLEGRLDGLAFPQLFHHDAFQDLASYLTYKARVQGHWDLGGRDCKLP